MEQENENFYKEVTQCIESEIKKAQSRTDYAKTSAQYKNQEAQVELLTNIHEKIKLLRNKNNPEVQQKKRKEFVHKGPIC